ncbi:MAG: DUF1467 family protein [Amphiplicatus sp.]
MSPIGAVVIFLLVWWLVLFAVLPWGVRGRWEEKDDGVVGADPGAPVAAKMKRKLLWTTIIAAVLWAIIVAVIASGVIKFHD